MDGPDDGGGGTVNGGTRHTTETHPWLALGKVVWWVLGLGSRARVEAPPELKAEYEERLALVRERHSEPPQTLL